MVQCVVSMDSRDVWYRWLIAAWSAGASPAGPGQQCSQDAGQSRTTSADERSSTPAVPVPSFWDTAPDEHAATPAAGDASGATGMAVDAKNTASDSPQGTATNAEQLHTKLTQLAVSPPHNSQLLAHHGTDAGSAAPPSSPRQTTREAPALTARLRKEASTQQVLPGAEPLPGDCERAGLGTRLRCQGQRASQHAPKSSGIRAAPDAADIGCDKQMAGCADEQSTDCGVSQPHQDEHIHGTEAAMEAEVHEPAPRAAGSQAQQVVAACHHSSAVAGNAGQAGAQRQALRPAGNEPRGSAAQPLEQARKVPSGRQTTFPAPAQNRSSTSLFGKRRTTGSLSRRSSKPPAPKFAASSASAQPAVQRSAHELAPATDPRSLEHPDSPAHAPKASNATLRMPERRAATGGAGGQPGSARKRKPEGESTIGGAAGKKHVQAAHLSPPRNGVAIPMLNTLGVQSVYNTSPTTRRTIQSPRHTDMPSAHAIAAHVQPEGGVTEHVAASPQRQPSPHQMQLAQAAVPYASTPLAELPDRRKELADISDKLQEVR
jgi:hypothetical protein